MRALEWLTRRGRADSVDLAVEAFEAEARFGTGTPSLGRFWSDLGSSWSPSILAALVKVDLRRRFESGERPKVLEYLQAFPVLAEVDDRVVSLVYEEFCLLEECGENPDSRAFCEAYGPWRDSLRSQLAYHRELSRAVGAESPPVNFPDLGDRFARYRLTSLLGVGGVARVYLATEEELGGRQLAIKVSATFGQEPSILAKLDHRNIVPILTVAESEAGLRGICMPYRPGLTLEELIRSLGRGTPPRSARAIDEAMRPRDSPADLPPDDQRVGWSDFRCYRTFPEAVAWIGLALADALAYLHEQGVFHRDIKPANILLAYREGPQLLDFNLAQEPNNPEGASAAQKGGTLPYMAPEQLKAFIDPSSWGDVGATADLYSLGLVLRELLTGRPPDLPTSQGSLAREIQSLIDRRLAPREPIREINPAVPASLQSIIDRCLAFQPEDRYQSANELAVDLRRFLDRKSLQTAPNTSKFELGYNWVHRNRRAIASTAAFVAVVAALGWFFASDIPGEARFLWAEACLDSQQPEDLVLASAEYDDLCKIRPDTARSWLGLALALYKLDRLGNSGRVSDMMKEANSKPDAEKVYRARLAREPGIYFLHLNLGFVLAAKHNFESARTEFQEALRINPKGYWALSLLARCEEKTGRYREAVAHARETIALGLETGAKAAKTYEDRRTLLYLLVEMIDQELKGGTTVASRAAVSEYREELESQLQALDQDWARLPAGGQENAYRFDAEYYQGCLASISGVLDSDPLDPKHSAALFDLAVKHFEKAKEIATDLTACKDRTRLVEVQETTLRQRRSRARS